MCVETVEAKVGADPAGGSLPSDWLGAMPSMKSLLSRFSGPTKTEHEAPGNEETLPAKLTKLVSEASGKFVSASGILLATATTSYKSTVKAIEGVTSSEQPVVAWELPTFPAISKDLGSWSFIRMFWEKTGMFSKESPHDASATSYTEMNDSDHSDGQGLEAFPNQGRGGTELDTDDASCEQSTEEAAVQFSAEVNLGLQEKLDSKENSPTIQADDAAFECPEATNTPEKTEDELSMDVEVAEDSADSPTQEGDAPDTESDNRSAGASVGGSANADESDEVFNGKAEEAEGDEPVCTD